MERNFFIRIERTEEEAISKARSACLGCTLATSLCDGPKVSSHDTPEALVINRDTLDRNDQAVLPRSTPDAPIRVVEVSIPSAPPSAWFTYFRLVADDIRSFIDLDDIKNVALSFATLAVFALVANQIISLIRTGKRETRSIPFQTIIGALFVCAGTIVWFAALYITTRLTAFGATLSVAGKMLLGSSVIGAALLTLPYSFWRMIGNLPISSSPPRVAPADQRPAEPPASSARGKRFAQIVEELGRYLTGRRAYFGFCQIPPVLRQLEQRIRQRLRAIAEQWKRGRTVDDDISSKSTNVTSPLSTSVSLVVQPPPQVIQVSQDASPQEPMVLRLKRSQKDGFRGTIYMLDARIDVSAEIRALIDKHKLSARVIYESEARQRHAATTRGHLEETRPAVSFGRVLSLVAKASVSRVLAALALQITVSSLMAGVHVECKSMDELLEAEGAIRAAKGNLEGYIAEILKFDGTEEIVI
jgi:hypothetical protein